MPFTAFLNYRIRYFLSESTEIQPSIHLSFKSAILHVNNSFSDQRGDYAFENILFVKNNFSMQVNFFTCTQTCNPDRPEVKRAMNT